MKRKIAFLLALVMLLSLLTGCAEETVPQLELEDRSESKTWETMPTFTFGQLETEKLAIVPWHDGRTESVQKNTWAETKDGYYRVSGSFLYYADKANLDTWVPVCNQPDCSHKDPSCNAMIEGNTIHIKEGRLWFLSSFDNYPQLHPGVGEINGCAIYSIAPDGTDPRLEYRNDALELSFMGGGSMGMQEGSRYIITTLTSLDADGRTNLTVLLLTKNGAKVVLQDRGEDLRGSLFFSPFYGDDAFYVYDISPHLLRLVGEELIPLDVSAYEENGGYLSGNFLRQYRPGGGYYDINLETGEEVKLCDPRLEKGTAEIMLPNCIVEYDLNSKDMDDNAPRSVEIFDGAVWRTVELPEELRYAQFTGNFRPMLVASDRILFSVIYFAGTYTEYTYYQVMLGQDTLTMELMGTMRTNR